MKITFKGKDINLLGTTLKKGEVFPNFKATNLDLQDFNLASCQNSKKLIFSIPSIDTGVCEIETTKFMNYFKDKNFTVIVVSMDTPFAFSRWCAMKNNNSIITLSDFKYNDFGLKTGTKIQELGLLTRAVFVVNEKNIIEYVEYVHEVSKEPNYEEILKFFDK